MMFAIQERPCHPERSEGSRSPGAQILPVLRMARSLALAGNLPFWGGDHDVEENKGQGKERTTG